MASVMIDRDIDTRLIRAARAWPAITLTGPRQSGKITLCRTLFPDRQYLLLGALDNRAFATEDPRGFLAQMPDGGIIDEVQRVPGYSLICKAIWITTQHPGAGFLLDRKTSPYRHQSASHLQGTPLFMSCSCFLAEKFCDLKIILKQWKKASVSGSYPRVFD